MSPGIFFARRIFPPLNSFNAPHTTFAAEYRLFVQPPSQNKTKPPHKETLCTAAGVELKSKNAHPKSVSALRTTSVARKSAHHPKIRLNQFAQRAN